MKYLLSFLLLTTSAQPMLVVSRTYKDEYGETDPDILKAQNISLINALNLYTFARAIENQDLARRCVAEMRTLYWHHADPEEVLKVMKKDYVYCTDAIKWVQIEMGRSTGKID